MADNRVNCSENDASCACSSVPDRVLIAEEQKSFAWEMLKEQGKANKRMFTSLIIVLFLWFSTIVGHFVWLNQYDFETTTTTTITSDTENGNGNAIANKEGSVNYNGKSAD